MILYDTTPGIVDSVDTIYTPTKEAKITKEETNAQDAIIKLDKGIQNINNSVIKDLYDIELVMALNPDSTELRDKIPSAQALYDVNAKILTNLTMPILKTAKFIIYSDDSILDGAEIVIHAFGKKFSKGFLVHGRKISIELTDINETYKIECQKRIALLDENGQPVLDKNDEQIYTLYQCSKVIYVDAYKDYEVEFKGKETYGFEIDESDDDPTTRVTYLEDCDNAEWDPVVMMIQQPNPYTATLTPAAGAAVPKGQWLDPKQWKDAFFLKDLIQVALNPKGEISYYLHPSDFTKQIDNKTASTINSATQDDNAMVGLPTCWVNVRYDKATKKTQIRISNMDQSTADRDQVEFGDERIWYAWAHTNYFGSIIPYIYLPLYAPTLDSKSRLRSVKGIAGTKYINTLASDQLTQLRANNFYDAPLWDGESFSDHQLITNLLILLARNTNIQSIFGSGDRISTVPTTGDKTDAKMAIGYPDGTINTLRNIFTYNSTATAIATSAGVSIRVFGMENYWGGYFGKSLHGLYYCDNVVRIKLTPGLGGDGTGLPLYNGDPDKKPDHMPGYSYEEIGHYFYFNPQTYKLVRPNDANPDENIGYRLSPDSRHGSCITEMATIPGVGRFPIARAEYDDPRFFKNPTNSKDNALNSLYYNNYDCDSLDMITTPTPGAKYIAEIGVEAAYLPVSGVISTETKNMNFQSAGPMSLRFRHSADNSTKYSASYDAHCWLLTCKPLTAEDKEKYYS